MPKYPYRNAISLPELARRNEETKQDQRNQQGGQGKGQPTDSGKKTGR